MPINSTPISVQLTPSQLIEGLAQLETPALEEIQQRIAQILSSRTETAPASVSTSPTDETPASVPIVEALIPSTLTVDINRFDARK